MNKPENFIKDRYKKKLNPNLIFTKFSEEDDKLIKKNIMNLEVVGLKYKNLFLKNLNYDKK